MPKYYVNIIIWPKIGSVLYQISYPCLWSVIAPSFIWATFVSYNLCSIFSLYNIRTEKGIFLRNVEVAVQYKCIILALIFCISVSVLPGNRLSQGLSIKGGKGTKVTTLTLRQEGEGNTFKGFNITIGSTVRDVVR